MRRPDLPTRLPKARAGFPSPAEDYLEGDVDLAAAITGGRRGVRLVEVPDPAGRAARVLLAVDPGIRPAAGDVVLAVADGEQVVATLRRGPDGPFLVDASGRAVAPAEASARGTVTWALRGFRDGPPPGAGFGFLTPSPASTFLFAVDGSSMRGAGIRDGDVLVVDRALVPANGDVVVASVGGGRTVKRLVSEGGRGRLAFEEEPDDLRFLPLNPEDTLFGVVTWCLHRMRAPAAPRGGRR